MLSSSTLFITILLLTVPALSLPSPNSSNRQPPRGALPPFTIQWNTNIPAGYRVATFADFASESFANFYNQNKGLSYDTTADPGGACGLAVQEGFLKYPLNDTDLATDVTFQDDNGHVSCFADLQTGQNGLVATMSSYGCGNYMGLVFPTPVDQDFFANNFFSNISTCEFYENQNRFTLFTLDTPPSPSPTPTLTPTPSPSPAASSNYNCCAYFNFAHSFQSYFCQYQGGDCPTISDYSVVGQFGVSSCSQCH